MSNADRRNERSRTRVVLCGMRYLGSPPALRELAAAGFDVRAVVMPAPRGTPPLTVLPPYPAGASVGTIPLMPALAQPGDDGREQHLDELARATGIPVLMAPSLRHPQAIEAIRVREPDVIAVSCFPLRMPPELLSLPRFGCINVHPSLLPKERGSEPVFWTLRRGETETGVTIHLMDNGFDTGPILVQERVVIPDGIRLQDLEGQLSGVGGRLLVRAIDGLVSGEITPVPQNDRLATTAPNPTDDDYVVPTDRPARWAYNFVRAVAPLDAPLTLDVIATGERFRVRDALSYQAEGRQTHPIEREGDDLTVQFTPGIARFQIAW